MIKHKLSNKFYIFSTLLTVIFSVGFRAIYEFTDTGNYSFFYSNLSNSNIINREYEFAFLSIAKFFSFLHLSVGCFFSFISFLSIFTMYLLTFKIYDLFGEKFNIYKLQLLLFSFLFISPFFLMYQANIIRQGLSASLVVYFYVLSITHSNFFLKGLVAIAAIGFHKSAAIYVVFSIFLLLPYSFSFFFSTCMLFSYLTGQSTAFNYLLLQISPMDLSSVDVIDYGASALNYSYRTGIRFDFAFFTFGLGLIFHYLAYFLFDTESRTKFFLLLKIYWLLMVPFFIFGFYTFSDRYLVEPWLYLSVLSAVFMLCFFKNCISIYIGYLCYFLSAGYFIFSIESLSFR